MHYAASAFMAVVEREILHRRVVTCCTPYDISEEFWWVREPFAFQMEAESAFGTTLRRSSSNLEQGLHKKKDETIKFALRFHRPRATAVTKEHPTNATHVLGVHDIGNHRPRLRYGMMTVQSCDYCIAMSWNVHVHRCLRS